MYIYIFVKIIFFSYLSYINIFSEFNMLTRNVFRVMNIFRDIVSLKILKYY